MSSLKIICKSGYIKSTKHVLNIVEYAGSKLNRQWIVFKDGTRLEVNAEQLIKLTPEQEQNLSHISIGFKDGGTADISYERYREKMQGSSKNLAAENFVDTSSGAVGEHTLGSMGIKEYLNYMGNRTGVQKSKTGHGWFGIHGDISADEVSALVKNYPDSLVWSHIVSLPEGTEKETGFDKREKWQALLAAEGHRMGKAYNIRPENLVIIASFHSNTDNAHNHILMFSKDPTEGHIRREDMPKATEKIKSIYVNTIFKDSLLAFHEERNRSRKELQNKLMEVLQCGYHSKVAEKILHLSPHIHTTKYGYLDKDVKLLVDEALKQIIQGNPTLLAMLQNYLKAEYAYLELYQSDPEKLLHKQEEVVQNFYHPSKNQLSLYHNAIVKACVQLKDSPTQILPSTAEEEMSFLEDIVMELDEIPFPNEPPTADEKIIQPSYSAAFLSTVTSFRDFEVKSDQCRGISYRFAANSGKFDQEINRLLRQKLQDILQQRKFSNAVKEITIPKIKNEVLKNSLPKSAIKNLTKIFQEIEKAEYDCRELIKTCKSIFDACNLSIESRKKCNLLLGELDKCNVSLLEEGINEELLLIRDGHSQAPEKIIRVLYHQDREFHHLVENNLLHIIQKFKKLYTAEDAKKYTQKYMDDFFGGTNAVPVNRSLKFFATHLNEHIYKKMLYNHKNAMVEIRKQVVDAVYNSCSDSQNFQRFYKLYQLISTLEKEKQSEAVDKEKISALYYQIRAEEKSIAQEIVGIQNLSNQEHIFQMFVPYLQNVFEESDQVAYTERLRTDIAEGELLCPFVHFFAKNFKTNVARKAMSVIGDDVKNFRSDYIKLLKESYICSKQTGSMEEIFTKLPGESYTMEDRMCDLEKQLGTSLSEKKEELFAKFSKQLNFATSHSLLEEEQRALFYQLYYGIGFDGIYVAETVKWFEDNRKEMLNEYKERMLRHTTENLIHLLMQLFKSHTQAVEKATQQAKKSSFDETKQFKTKRQFQEKKLDTGHDVFEILL